MISESLMLLMGLGATGWVFALGILAMSFWGLAPSATQALMTRRVSPSEQGQLQGAIGSLEAAIDTVQLLRCRVVLAPGKRRVDLERDLGEIRLCLFRPGFRSPQYVLENVCRHVSRQI